MPVTVGVSQCGKAGNKSRSRNQREGIQSCKPPWKNLPIGAEGHSSTGFGPEFVPEAFPGLGALGSLSSKFGFRVWGRVSEHPSVAEWEAWIRSNSTRGLGL